MWFRNPFNLLASSPFRNPVGRTRRLLSRRRPAATGLQLEALEDRCLPSFLPAVSYPVGAQPFAVVTGAFRGAGHPLDLAVANTDSNTVSILLGKGDGTFQPAQNYATGASPHSLAVGDFNGDGQLDIVTTNYGSATVPGTVSVLLGNGDGTFAAPINFTLPGEFPPGYTGTTPVPQVPIGVAVGDMNHDGRLDLVVTADTSFSPPVGSNVINGYVNVLLGQGNGTFAPATTSLLNTSQKGDTPLRSVALADFNGDGNLDIAALSEASSVFVLLGNGDGTVRAPTHFATGLNSYSLAVGDVNGDGKLDLVTTNTDYSAVNGVSVLLGNGDGTFQGPINTSLPSLPGLVPGQPTVSQTPWAVAVGDLNGDGKLDLAVTTNSLYTVITGSGFYGNYYGYALKGNVNVLLGHGDGTFTDAQIAPANGAYPYFLTAGNFNSDALPDLEVTDPHANTVSVLLNAADWPTSGQASRFAVSGFPSSTTAGVAGSFTVTAKNTNGTTATGYTGTVHFTSSDGQAVLPANYTFTAADHGTHTFSATLLTAGTQSVTATDVATAGPAGSETGITVNPAAASQLVFGQQPGTTTSGQAISPAVTVSVEDQYGNVVTSNNSTVTLTLSSGTFEGRSATARATASGGVATFSTLKIDTAGSYTLRVTDGSLTAASSGSFSVTPSTLAVAGFPSPVTAGVAGSFTVTVKNADGTTATGYTGTVHFTSSDPHAVLPADYTFTATDRGVHTFSATLKTAGTQSITVTDTTTGGLTGSETGITVNPAAASTLNVTGFPSPITAGVAGGFTVTARDPFGNIANSYTGTVHFSSSDARSALPGNYTFTAADAGVHSFSATLKTAATQSITATDTTTSTITGTDAGITVNPAVASQFIISAPSSVTAGTQFSLTVKVEDAYGNVVNGYTGTVHFSSTDGTATLPANYTFTAADKGVHTFTGPVLRKMGNQKITITDTLNSSLTASVIVDVLNNQNQ